MQVHYEGIHKIDPQTGERGEVVDELQEAVVQCLDCMHDQPHLGFRDGRVEPIEDRWERMIAGTPWVASCTVTVDADDVETCCGPEAGDALSYAAFGDHGTREFFTHVRFHKHDDEHAITVHLLVELYARSLDEATEVLEEAARGASPSPRSPRSRAAPGRDHRRRRTDAPAAATSRRATAPRQLSRADVRRLHRGDRGPAPCASPHVARASATAPRPCRSPGARVRPARPRRRLEPVAAARSSSVPTTCAASEAIALLADGSPRFTAAWP